MTTDALPALRIGLDAEALRLPLSGVGHYVLNLCLALDRLWPEAEFFVYGRLPAQRLAPLPPRWTLRQEPWAWARRLPSFLWLRTRGRALCRADALDVFWAGRTLHPGRGAARRIVCTVHDLNHRLVPETMERATRVSHRLWFDADVRSADQVVSNSRGTSERLRQWLGRAADRVVRPGVRAEFHPLSEPAEREQALRQLADLGITVPYVLAVSTLEPRKNMGALVDAYLLLHSQGRLPRGCRLVLVGARGWQNEALAARIAAAASAGVVLPGYVPDALMPALYALAEVLAMPSLYEGFGMPVLEARACGTPVLVSDVPELKEAADGQAVVVAPTPEALAEGLAHMLNGAAARPRYDGPRGWHDAARAMAEVLAGRTRRDEEAT